jgi:hypothetical protein
MLLVVPKLKVGPWSMAVLLMERCIQCQSLILKAGVREHVREERR